MVLVFTAPAFPETREVTVGDAPLVRAARRRMSGGACECSFANLIIWKDFDRPAFTFLNGNLCIRIDPIDEPPFFLEPMGGHDIPGTVEALMQTTGRISRVSLAFASQVGRDGYRHYPLQDHRDYIYRTQELAELKGRRYDGKRNHIKRMMRRHPEYAYRELTRSDAREALALFDEWSRHRSGSQRQGKQWPGLAYSCQRQAVERAFEHYDELHLMGGALVVEGGLAGFLLGSAERDDVACLHLSYAHPDVPGSFQTLLWEACRKNFSRFEYLNLEQDLGLAGLRRTKQSYHPVRFEEKFEVCRRKEGA